MKVSKFKEQVVSYDDRRSFQLLKGKRGIQVWMNGKHWMPPKPFPTGFDPKTVEFDTVESAVDSVKALLGLGRFTIVNEGGEVVENLTTKEYVQYEKRSLGLIS